MVFREPQAPVPGFHLQAVAALGGRRPALLRYAPLPVFVIVVALLAWLD